MDIEIRCIAHGPAVFGREPLEPCNEKIFIFEEVRWGRSIKGDHVSPVPFVWTLIQAGPAPGVIGLVGVRAEPDQHIQWAVRRANHDVGNVLVAVAVFVINEVDAVVTRGPAGGVDRVDAERPAQAHHGRGESAGLAPDVGMRKLRSELAVGAAMRTDPKDLDGAVPLLGAGSDRKHERKALTGSDAVFVCVTPNARSAVITRPELVEQLRRKRL